MTLSELVPSLDLCQQLKATGFPQDTAIVWFIYGESVQLLEHEQVRTFEKPLDEGIAAPTAGELEEWLMTKLPFSKRMTSVAVERVLLHTKDKEATYRVTGMGIGGLRVIVGKASIIAALAALVLEVAE